MIPVEQVTALIKSEFSDGELEIIDKTGASDHFIIRVMSKRFEGVNLLDRHRMVMSALQPAFDDGRLHAAEIQTAVPSV